MSGKVTRVATDVGGTFTDLVCFETSKAGGAPTVTSAKADTTPPDFETGVMAVLAKGGISPAAIDFLVHGTTVVINAITERRGCKVGLITTAGFRDTLEIARGNRPDFFNLHYRKPAPFVPRHLRRELPGRVSYRGEELEKLDLAPLAGIVEEFKAEGVEAVAICFLHSYADTSHELQALGRLGELWPEVPAVCSHQITREWREYERTSTTVLSAYVQPVAERYLKRLAEALGKDGFKGSAHIMQSNCGAESLESVARVPITMVESGPASGIWGAAELGREIGENNVIALDIGGTTAKCSLIQNGQVRIMTDYWIERDRRSAGYPIMVPVVDLVEIGNGGGSIAWIDDFRKLHVGPRSAGAKPGPAAYGRGGTEATTTDANLMLGRINRDYFCDGEIDADIDATESALAALGKQLGGDAHDAARGIIRIANNNMVNALKLISINRGYDPREFTMVAFGGGGGMHASALAQELGVAKVVVPAGASVFSAWGMMMSDLRRDYIVTYLVEMGAKSADALERHFVDIETQARKQYVEEGIEGDKVKFKRYGRFRYQNQEHTTEVALGEQKVTADSVAGIVADFHAAYESEYTYRLDAPVEMVGIHLVASADIGGMSFERSELGGEDAAPALKGQRKVDYALEGIHDTSIYDWEAFVPGMKFAGPAIVEGAGTTVVVHPGDKVEIDGYRNVVISVREKLNG